MILDNFWALQTHNDITEFFARMGLARYFSLRPWGIDVKRAWQLMTSIEEDGTTHIEDLDNQLITVKISIDMVAKALIMPRGGISMTAKLTPKEISQTFLSPKTAEHTFKGLSEKECELPLRIFTQHFQLGRPVRYTTPNTKLAMVFSKAAVAQNTRLISADFAEFIFTELVTFAKKKKYLAKPLMNGGHFLTRLAYFALGQIDQLPRAYEFKDLLEQANPDAKPMKSKLTQPEQKTKPSTPVESSEEEEDTEAGDTEAATTEEENDSEEEESDPEAEHPAHSEIRARYEQLSAQVERRTKRRAEGVKSPEKRPTPLQPQEDPQVIKARKERMQEQVVRMSLMEAERQKILKKLGKRPIGQMSMTVEEEIEDEIRKKARHDEEEAQHDDVLMEEGLPKEPHLQETVPVVAADPQPEKESVPEVPIRIQSPVMQDPTLHDLEPQPLQTSEPIIEEPPIQQAVVEQVVEAQAEVVIPTPSPVQAPTGVHIEETMGILSPLAAIGSTYGEIEVSTSDTQPLMADPEADIAEQVESGARQELPSVTLEVVARSTETTDEQPTGTAQEDAQAGSMEGLGLVQQTLHLLPSQPEVPSSSTVMMDATEAEHRQQEVEVLLQAVQDRVIQFRGVHLMARQREQELEEKKLAEKALLQRIELHDSEMATFKAESEGRQQELQRLQVQLEDAEGNLSKANEVV